ncbi:MAG TPA: spore maturation protein [Candidatus Avidehalobacter gallistercoris]|mgnify:CR=1 FL=1|uniref:Spore maturation protein n=1 Tax=Candidatus Avidehalobacter gallistercoris TaxID=2840694 RepID=A0A9D1HJJ0_9FIRM|nr:spore maturation protein [Candidatus Avidehalobacter gallistercoris]
MAEYLGLAVAWLIPLLLVLLPLYALYKRVDVYAVFCSGAAEGLALLIKILPNLLAMLVAIEVFKSSGALDMLLAWLTPLAQALGIPADILPLSLLRSLSGSGALAMTSQLIDKFGADSFVGRLASTMQGSTDTTLYVLAVYFGAVGVTRSRHALAVGLLADVAAFIAAFWLCRLVWG